MKKLWTISFCVSFLLSPIIHAIKDPVVADVNGVKITRSELEKSYHQNLLFVSNKMVTLEKTLNDLINRILGIQAARKENLQNNPVVKSKMEDVLYHAKISKDLESRLKKIVSTDSDVKNYYRDHPEYRTAHILFRVRAIPSEEEVKGTQKTAIEVYRSVIKRPKKFSEFANKYSQSNSAPRGGDMGFQPAIRMAPEYFLAIKGKPPGHITPPVRTQFGYHIIKILAVKSYNDIDKDLYKKIVYDRKRDKVLESYFAGLRQNAKVTINQEYLQRIPQSPQRASKSN